MSQDAAAHDASLSNREEARATSQRLNTDRGMRPRLIAVAVVVALSVVILAVLFVPDYFVGRDSPGAPERLTPKQLLDAKNDARATVLQGIGGMLLVITALFSWRQVRIGHSQVHPNQDAQRATERQQARELHVTQEAQLTDRFTRAVEQLGSDMQDVRIGAVYSLERIARDSASDRAAIVDILAAYVRGHAVTNGGDPPSGAGSVPGEDERLRREPIGADINSAMTVLGRLHPRRNVSELLELSGESLTFTWAPPGPALERVDLRGIAVKNANLQAALLQAARLDLAVLSGSDLTLANLNGASLSRATLLGTSLPGAFLIGARASNIVAEGADFGWTKLAGCDLTGANLRGVTFLSAYLGGVDLSIEWRDPELQEYEDAEDDDPERQQEFFRRETIQTIRRYAVDPTFMRGVNVQGGRIEPAVLDGADIRGADFSLATLDDASLDGAIADTGTTWPLGFDPQRTGVVLL